MWDEVPESISDDDRQKQLNIGDQFKMNSNTVILSWDGKTWFYDREKKVFRNVEDPKELLNDDVWILEYLKSTGKIESND